MHWHWEGILKVSGFFIDWLGTLLTSWPFVVGVLTIILTCKFQADFRGVLKRLEKFAKEKDGGFLAQFSSNQPVVEASGTVAPSTSISIDDPPQEDPRHLLPKEEARNDYEDAIVNANLPVDFTNPEVKKLLPYMADLAMRLGFEAIYRLIFGSQVELLVRLDQVPLSDASITEHFFRAKNQWPNVYHSWESSEIYMRFLLGSRLVAKDGEHPIYKLTPRGKAFLRWLSEQRLPAKGG